MSDHIIDPYPVDVFTMTREELRAALPDKDTRTAVAGYLSRRARQVMTAEVRQQVNEQLEGLAMIDHNEPARRELVSLLRWLTPAEPAPDWLMEGVGPLARTDGNLPR